MRQIALRDQAALAALYRQYSSMVYGVAMRVLQNSVLAEEVMQDTFVKVWREPQKWNPDGGRLLNWLLTVTRYTAIDRLRKERRQPPLSAAPLEDIPHLMASGDIVGDALWQDVHLLESLLGRLPPAQLQVIQLSFWQGLTHEEISRQLNVPLGTVKSRLQLGLQKLRDMVHEASKTVS